MSFAFSSPLVELIISLQMNKRLEVKEVFSLT